MKVKLCAVKSEADIEAVIESGADYAGFLVGQSHVSSDFVSPETAHRLSGLLPSSINPIIVTHFSQPKEIAGLIEQTGITTIQLHGNSSPDQIRQLREQIAGLFLVHVLHVGSDSLCSEHDRYCDVVDAFLLDSADSSRGMVGGTGLTHDWSISADFVAYSSKPVFLAGGLNPGNVASAIAAVKPAGVDVNSGVKAESGERDSLLCSQFVFNAHHSSE